MPGDLEAGFIELFSGPGHKADKILGQLRSQFPDVPREDVTDVFNEACAEIISRHKAGKDTSNIPGLITTIARNMLQDVRKARYTERDHQEFLAARIQDGWRHDEERQARIERATKYVRDLVAAWDSENHRRTMTLLLDAASEGMTLTPKEIDKRLGCARGTGGVWKQRCLDRLRVDLEREGVLIWDDLLDALPLGGEDPNDRDNDEEYFGD